MMASTDMWMPFLLNHKYFQKPLDKYRFMIYNKYIRKTPINNLYYGGDLNGKDYKRNCQEA
jgi:hypothetical protein